MLKFFPRSLWVALLLLSSLLFICVSPVLVLGVSTDASFSVTSPRQGEVVLAGQPYSITWTYGGDVGRYIQIQLYQGGKYKSTISSYTSAGSSGSGSYTWKPSLSLAEGEDYQIKISSRSASKIFAFSGNFTIRKSAQPEQSFPSSAPNAFTAPSRRQVFKLEDMVLFAVQKGDLGLFLQERATLPLPRGRWGKLAV